MKVPEPPASSGATITASSTSTVPVLVVDAGGRRVLPVGGVVEAARGDAPGRRGASAPTQRASRARGVRRESRRSMGHRPSCVDGVRSAPAYVGVQGPLATRVYWRRPTVRAATTRPTRRRRRSRRRRSTAAAGAPMRSASRSGRCRSPSSLSAPGPAAPAGSARTTPSSAASTVITTVGGSPCACPPQPPYERNAGSRAYDAAHGTQENAVRRSTTLPSSAARRPRAGSRRPPSRRCRARAGPAAARRTRWRTRRCPASSVPAADRLAGTVVARRRACGRRGRCASPVTAWPTSTVSGHQERPPARGDR